MQCANCSRDVAPGKSFNFLAFLFFLILCGIPALVYVIYYMTKSSNQCPVCKKDVYTGR